ncbi:MAG TPA: adenylate/guanylate cyclase domain-containing protein [Pseudolabrys sp.]|nr:adenylate/guanylate cyclase domain-containing protein [Pseudolabrys sp.]
MADLGGHMKRKIAAIMAADVAGYSRLVAEDEEETLRRLESYRAVFDDFIARASGRVFNTAGDAILAEFSSSVEAVRCAIDVQESLRTRNLAYPPSRQMNFRIGITVGDIVERDGDLLGDAVNIAARLEGLAVAGGVCVSRAVYEQVGNKLSVHFNDDGEKQVKNIPTPVHVFSVTIGGDDARAAATAAVKPKSKEATTRPAWLWPAAIAGGAALALAAVAGFFLLPRAAEKSAPAVVAAPEKPAPAAVAASDKPAAAATAAGDKPAAAVTAAAPDKAAAIAAAPPAAKAVALIPETVPFIGDPDRASIRSAYLNAPGEKALAIGLMGIGMATGQPDADTAKAAALANCERTLQSAADLHCSLYATNDNVVFAGALPTLPPPPWLIRNAEIETPYSSENVPLVRPATQTQLAKVYEPRPNAKALALSPRGQEFYYYSQRSVDEAVRRALERCGLKSGLACMIVAVDDVFVVPIPSSMKPTGLFHAASDTAINADMREDVARRLANAPNAWNAVAVGAAGVPGVKLKASDEDDAIEGAVADRRRRDRDCRVIAIGPFTVEALP